MGTRKDLGKDSERSLARCSGSFVLTANRTEQNSEGALVGSASRSLGGPSLHASLFSSRVYATRSTLLALSAPLHELVYGLASLRAPPARALAVKVRRRPRAHGLVSQAWQGVRAGFAVRADVASAPGACGAAFSRSESKWALHTCLPRAAAGVSGNAASASAGNAESSGEPGVQL